MLIRTEQAGDFSAVYDINAAAFSSTAEAELVEELRGKVSPYISLVAEEEGQISGHIMFAPVHLSGHESLKIMSLGPVAVLPDRQGKGVGSALIRAGLRSCVELGYGACVVLGHSTYYPRFGFIPSVKFGIGSEYDVPPEAFMVMELIPGYLQGATGTIRYHPAFKDV